MDSKQISSPFQAMTEIVLRPNRVFATIKDTENWSWIPFLLIAIFSVLPAYIYFSGIDFNWYMDLIINSEYSDVSPAEQEMFRSSMTQDSMVSATIIFSIFGLLLFNAIHALFLHRVTKIDDENVMTYGDWFGFTWWVSIPYIFTALLALLILLFFMNPQMYPTDINPTSLAFLFNVKMGSDWFALAQAIKLETIWTIYLVAVGVSQWTKLTSKQCYIIAIAPPAIVWGVWTLFILF